VFVTRRMSPSGKRKTRPDASDAGGLN